MRNEKAIIGSNHQKAKPENRTAFRLRFMSCVIVKTCSDSLFSIGQKTVSCLLRSYATFLTLTTGWCYINAIRFYCFLILEFVFPCDGNPFDKSLHGCFPKQYFPEWVLWVL